MVTDDIVAIEQLLNRYCFAVVQSRLAACRWGTPPRLQAAQGLLRPRRDRAAD